MSQTRHVAFAALALAAVCAAVGLSRVHYHLMDDQTLFLRGAEMLRNGGTLYRDLWDIKPPGIFLFYYLGGTMFGFTDIGIRVFELLVFVSFAVIAFLWLRSAIGELPAWLGAFLTVFFYYTVYSEAETGNVEGLACLPAAIAGLGLLAPRSKWRLALAGAAVGVLILLKPFYGLIGAAFWLVFLIADREVSRRAGAWAILLVSAAIPLAATAAWFAHRGALHDLYNALIVVPYEARFIDDPSKRVGYLIFGFVHRVGAPPLRLLLIPALWAAHEKRRDHRLLTAVAILGAWMVAGTACVALQLQGWFFHQWILILPPVAILAGFGLDWTLTQLLRAPLAQRVLAAGFLAAVLWTARGEARTIASALWSGKGQAQPSAYFEKHLGQLRYDAQQVKCAPSETALVWLSPIVYRYSNCRPASPVDGTSMRWMPPDLIARVREDIRRGSPRYIYLRKVDFERFGAAMPGVLEQYQMGYQSPEGAWFELKIRANLM